MKGFFAFFTLALALLATGCSTGNKKSTDYSAFRESKPRSILVLPPKNQSPDVNASNSLLSVVTMPLAESGYYVFPVAVVSETFKQNGVTNPDDISSVPLKKLHDSFGADAVMYISITDYGTSYQVVNSDTRVTATARLVDSRTGKELWTGGATASSNEGQKNSGGGLIGILLTAAITQIAHTSTDKAHDIAEVTGARMFSAGSNGGLLYGPRSPNYNKTQL
ncbi:Putative lipoprotein NMB1124/NMB1162 precursor [Raoultella terrigena]|nr:Putative lipoprotein NMB1124/NMB1162 precursor [Raoultella terrigena]